MAGAKCCVSSISKSTLREKGDGILTVLVGQCAELFEFNVMNVTFDSKRDQCS